MAIYVIAPIFGDYSVLIAYFSHLEGENKKTAFSNFSFFRIALLVIVSLLDVTFQLGSGYTNTPCSYTS